MRTTPRAIGLVLATTTLGLAACTRADDRGTATDRDGTVDSAGAMAGTNAMTQDTAGDQSIAAVLATVDRAEIQSSRVALQKAASGDVKRFAQKMIDEHVRTSQQLAAIARKGNLMVPDSTQLDRDLGVMEGGSMGGTGSGAMTGTTGDTGMRASTGMSGGTTAATGNPVGTGSAASGTGRGEAMRPDSASASSRGNATMSPNAILQEMHSDAQRAMATLRPLRGAEFDRAYMDAQVAMHSKTLNALGNLSASARDTELRAHIDKVTRHVQEHLQEGQTIRQRLGGGR